MDAQVSESYSEDTDLYFDDQIWFTEEEKRKGNVYSGLVTERTKHLYIKYYLRNYLILSRQTQLEAMKAGFHSIPLFTSDYFSSSSSRNQSDDNETVQNLPKLSLSSLELKLLLTGVESISCDTLLDNINFDIGKRDI